MIKGVTPVETAFELMGLMNSQAIMKWIFFDTFGGALIFAVGMVTSLAIAVEKGSFKAVWLFASLFFVTFFLFVIPTARVDGVTSTMEQSGFQGVTTQNIVQEKGYSNSEINPVLSVISDLMSSFSIGLVEALENMAGGGKNSYLKSPFLIAKLVTLVNQTVQEGIKDPQLKKKTIEFYQNDYLPTLQMFMDRNKTAKDLPDLWPGSPEIVAAYSTEAKANWKELSDELGLYLQKGITGSSGAGAALTAVMPELDLSDIHKRNDLVKNLMKYDIKLSPTAYATAAWQHAGFTNVSSDVASKKNWWTGVGSLVSDVGAMITQPISVSIAASMLHGFVYVQGFSLLLMFTFFPFTIIWTILQREPKVMVEFLKNLFWVKSWTLCWGVINIASVYVWEIQRLLHGSSGVQTVVESAFFLNITSVFMIATPIVTYSLLTGAMSGLGVVATMANLHADKGVEMVNKSSQGFARNIGKKHDFGGGYGGGAGSGSGANGGGSGGGNTP